MKCEYNRQADCANDPVGLYEVGATVFNSREQEPLGWRSPRWLCEQHRKAIADARNFEPRKLK